MIRRIVNLAGAAALALAVITVVLAGAQFIADAPGTLDRLSGSVIRYRGPATTATPVPDYPPGVDVLTYDAAAPGGVSNSTPTPAPSTGLVAVRAVPTETPVPAEITVTATPLHCYVPGSGVISCSVSQATAAAVAARTPPPAEVTVTVTPPPAEITVTPTPAGELACEQSYVGCQPTPTPDIARRQATAVAAIYASATAFAAGWKQ